MTSSASHTPGGSLVSVSVPVPVPTVLGLHPLASRRPAAVGKGHVARYGYDPLPHRHELGALVQPTMDREERVAHHVVHGGFGNPTPHHHGPHERVVLRVDPAITVTRP